MMFEEGNRLRAIYGADKVYDFSLRNPSVPAPECVKEAIIDLVNEVEPTVLHGYMSNAGFEDVRQTIAESLNHRFGTKFAAKNLIMTVGAASGLNVIFKTILNPEEEVIVFAPYFLEYGAYVRNFAVSYTHLDVYKRQTEYHADYQGHGACSILQTA